MMSSTNCVIAVIIAVIAACSAGNTANAADVSEQEQGFVSLFDGKTLDGWQGAMEYWITEDGKLIYKAAKKARSSRDLLGLKLMSTKQYADFVLRFEFLLTEHSNNGVAIRAPLEGDPAFVGMEIQVIDNLRWRLKRFQHHGSIYGVVPAKTGHLKPVDRWNTQEIMCLGRRVKVTLNGAVILESNLDEVSPIDGKKHQGLKRKQGYIGFLGHTGRVEFRNIRIKELTADLGKSPASAPGPPYRPSRFVVLPVENPRYCGNELFRAFENYHSPRIRQLRERYGLDGVVADETDEWRRILLLRHWIKSTIAIDNDNPTKTRGDAFAILDAALKGGKFHCAHFSIVQHAVLNSFGYVTRRLGCGPGLKDDGGHHGVNEVWVNKFSKWVLIDAKYDVHFEKNKVPLSALEIRDEVWRDGAQSVVRVVGPDRRPMTPDPETGKWETRPDTYRWCSWETSTSRFSTFPAKLTSTLIMLEDDMFKKNVWLRDGKRHWAYDTPYMMRTTRRDWIEWTPNVITSSVRIEDAKTRVSLGSCTPNFRSFQIKGGNGAWSDCGEDVELPLSTSTRNRFTFRTVNLFGVTGPEHRAEIVWTSRKGDQL